MGSNSSAPVVGSETGSWIQRVRVPLGFLFGLAFLIVADPGPPFLWPGIGVAGVGLLLRIWASGHLHKHRELSCSGPYRWTRNPLYLGSFVMGLGFCLAARSWVLAVLFAVLYPAIYLPVMRREEAELLGAYGEPYREYRDSAPLFFPSGRSAEGSRDAFDCGWVLKNREYKAMAGFLLLAAFLVWKQGFSS